MRRGLGSCDEGARAEGAAAEGFDDADEDRRGAYDSWWEPRDVQGDSEAVFKRLMTLKLIMS